MLSMKQAFGLTSMTAALVCTLGMGVNANAAEVTPPPTETVNGITCQKMFRFYNPYTYEHLYTTDVKEAADLRSRGWNAEGIGWYSPVKDTPGVVKIYRLYNPYGDDHLYTTEEKEKDDCIKRGWKLDTTFEAYGFISKQLGANAGISRLFNPYEKYHTHLFSADKKELEDNIKRGWKDEQVRWYVPGKPAEATPSATDTDVNVSTGPGPSHAKEPKKPTTTPVLTEEQKTILAEYLKPVSELVAATRTNILKGGKTPEEAVQALQTKANEAKTNAENLKKQADATGASDEVKKQAATATLVQEEAEFNVTYATHVKALNDVKAAYDKKQTDSTLKAKYGAALKDVENDENKFVPVTYTLHFKNDPQGKTGKECSLKDTQVTVYKCIAGQVYHSDERTKSIMRKVPRYTVPGVINDVLKYSNQMDSNRCIRYNKNTNAFDVEFTLKDVGYHDIPSFFPQSCEPVDDAYNITGLPELNLTFLGKDTHMYHATKNDTIETIDAQLRKIDNGEMGESKYYTMPSHRKALITKEFISTEGKCKAAYIEFYKYFKLFKEDAEKPENSVEMQNNILRLKRYELAYNAAKEKNDEQAMLKARSLADIWAHALLDPRKYYLDIENVQYRPAESLDIRLRFLDALSLGILQRDLPKPDASEEKKQQHRELLNSYVKWMENPRDTKIFDKVKAAEIAYNGSVNDFDVYFMNDLNTNHTIY